MKAVRAYVLRFDDGERLPYGVPDFLTEDEALDFLAHIEGELEEGAAEYFAQCCGGQHTSSGATGDEDDEEEAPPPQQLQTLSFGARPSAKVRRLEARAEWLRARGLAALQVRLEAERRAREAELERQQQALARQQALRRWKQDEPKRDRGRGR